MQSNRLSLQPGEIKLMNCYIAYFPYGEQIWINLVYAIYNKVRNVQVNNKFEKFELPNYAPRHAAMRARDVAMRSHAIITVSTCRVQVRGL